MDRSLDDIIKDNQTSKPKYQKFQGKVKSQPNRGNRKNEPYQNNRPQVARSVNVTNIVPPPPPSNTGRPNFTVQKQMQVNNTPAGGIFDRIGTKGSQKSSSGTSVTISNLNNDVTLADLSELCGTMGEVLSATFVISPNANSKKQAIVIFARRSDALTFVQKFHNLTLDGTPMDIKLSGVDGKENPFNPIQETPVAPNVSHTQMNNKRSGLFGTALHHTAVGNVDIDDNEEEDYDDEDGDGEDEDDGDDLAPAIGGGGGGGGGNRTSFSITLNDRNHNGGSGSGGQRQVRQQNQGHNHNNNNKRRLNQQRSNNNNNNNRNTGNKRHQSRPKENVTGDDLDNALDSYMSSR